MERSLSVLPEIAPVDMNALVASFFEKQSARTQTAYRSDLADFASFLGATTAGAAADLLLRHDPGAANALALRYRTYLIGRGLAAATVNRRLAALRSLVALAHRLGFVMWTLDVDGVKGQPYRDTRGPGTQGVDALLDAIEARVDVKGARDAAIIALLFDVALRRNEVVSLDRAHLDLSAGTLAILGKGRTGRETITLPPQTREALARWLVARGDAPGPLFINLDPCGKRGEAGDGRLTGSGVYKLVRRLGEQAHIGPVRPTWSSARGGNGGAGCGGR